MRSVLTQRDTRWRTDILYPPDASTPQRVIIDVNQFPDEFTVVGEGELTVVGEGETLPAFDLEAAVNSIVSLAQEQASAGAVVAMDVDPLAPPGPQQDEEEEDSDDDMEMVC